MKIALKFQTKNPIGVLKDLDSISAWREEFCASQTGLTGNTQWLGWKTLICIDTREGKHTFTAKVENGTPVVECLFEGSVRAFNMGAESVAGIDDVINRADCKLLSIFLDSDK